MRIYDFQKFQERVFNMADIKKNTYEEATDAKHAQNAKAIPAWLQYAFIKASEVFKYNCAWGFISAAEANGSEFKALEQDFVQNNGKMVRVNKVSNGLVFELPFELMPKIFKTVVPEYPDAEIKRYCTENQAEYEASKAECLKVIEKMIKDAQKAPNKTSVVDLGLYCANKTFAIKYGDTLCKSFKMSIPTFLQLLDQKGYKMKFGVQSIDGKSPVIPLSHASIGKVIKIADSKNGIVFKLICTA